MQYCHPQYRIFHCTSTSVLFKRTKYVQSYTPNLTGGIAGYTTHDAGIKMDRANIIDVFSPELWLMDGNF